MAKHFTRFFYHLFAVERQAILRVHKKRILFAVLDLVCIKLYEYRINNSFTTRCRYPQTTHCPVIEPRLNSPEPEPVTRCCRCHACMRQPCPGPRPFIPPPSLVLRVRSSQGCQCELHVMTLYDRPRGLADQATPVGRRRPHFAASRVRRARS